MLFLIEYNRQAGVIVYQKTFAEAERQQADDERLRRELALSLKPFSSPPIYSSQLNRSYRESLADTSG